MKLKIYYLFFLITAIIFINCSKTTKSDVDWGNADFSTFVSLGNSLTAGVSDGALFEDAQKNSFPNLIAKMAEVGDDFEQPIMSDNGFSFNETDGRFSLNLSTFSIDILPSGSEKNKNLGRAFNNLGIPLIRANQMYSITNSAQTDSNHFVDKILRRSGNTPIQEALSLNPTLITLWVGNNDVLEAAALGLADKEFLYTEVNEFSTHFNSVITRLTAGTDAPIYVANIFDLTDLPYFTSLPSKVVNPNNGDSAFLFGDCKDGIRRLTDEDLVLFWALPDYFTLRSNIGGINETNALNDTLILDIEEKAEIQNIIDSYNDIIENVVNSNNQLFFIDMYSLFKGIANNGYELGGENYTNNLVSFNNDGSFDINAKYTLFSIDGLHPNGNGYASIANAFIDVINSTQNANIPMVSASDL